MSYISVDVDIDDVLQGMSSRDKQELTDDLYNDGYIPTPLSHVYYETDDFSLSCKKLVGQSWRLSREEEEFIINLAKRF